MQQQHTVGLTYANYNYAFTSFFEQYKNICLKVSQNIDLLSLSSTRKIVTTFVYENEYTVDEIEKRAMYRRQLLDMKRRSDTDNTLMATFNKDLEYTANKIIYKIKYYEYFLGYLTILGNFVAELTTTYMPNTKLQRKLLRFTNTQMFFEKFTQHKEKVIEKLVDFSMENFTETFNMLVTFYFAYSLFVNEDDRVILIEMFSLALSFYLDKDNLALIAKEDPTKEQRMRISKIEAGLHRILLFCQSLMNQSFSEYDVLPKLRDKVYIDRTLI